MFAALSEALAFIHSDKAGAMEIAKKRFPNAKSAILVPAFDRMVKYYSKDGHFGRKHVANTQAIAVDLKIMPKAYPYDEVVAPMAREK